MNADLFFLISAANKGPKRFHQARIVSWLMSMPRSWSRSSTFLSESGKQDVHHHRKTDNLRGCLEIAEGILHPKTLRDRLAPFKQFSSDKAAKPLVERLKVGSAGFCS